MAINFPQQKKRLKILLPVVVGLALLTAGNIWWAFLRKPSGNLPAVKTVFLPPKLIEVDWDILSSQELENLEPFPAFQSLESGVKVGRPNPFLPIK